MTETAEERMARVRKLAVLAQQEKPLFGSDGASDQGDEKSMVTRDVGVGRTRGKRHDRTAIILLTRVETLEREMTQLRRALAELTRELEALTARFDSADHSRSLVSVPAPVSGPESELVERLRQRGAITS